MRILLLTHEDLATGAQRSESRFVQALCALNDVHTVYWEDVPNPSFNALLDATGIDRADVDACVFFIRFRYLLAQPRFDWGSYVGRRVWLEHDAWANYSPEHPAWHGTYPAVYSRDGFDTMVSTGKQTTALLRGDGVNAVWIPKGYSEDTFYPLGGERSGICTFGTQWPSRRAMIAHLSRHGIVVNDVSGPFNSLNSRLNRHSLGVVCNMTAVAPWGRIGRAIRRKRPSFNRLGPAIEPMIKSFETAAAGCALVIDRIDELADLGFEHGQTCLTYGSFDDAVEILRSTEPDEVSKIGAAGAELVRSRHTWAHRARQMTDLLHQPA